ncbi:MAG: AAA family ATPase [Spirochaetales bacterium]|nr:AAA family ATPase [Spirochaetales bacterium]
MIDKILAIYNRLMNSLDSSQTRYLVDTFDFECRLAGIVGARGVGKTTFMLQYIKEKIGDRKVCVYASMDNLYFSSMRLFDFVDHLYLVEGVRYFFLDEVHMYPDWEQELKNVYDSFPDVKIVFSGSSSLDIRRGGYDLSRRAVVYQMAGLSFREYLYFSQGKSFAPLTLEQILAGEGLEEILNYPRMLGLFKEYLDFGFYPFFLEGKRSYNQKVLNMIDKTIYEDIPAFYSLKTDNMHYFRKIIAYIATIPPGELNRNSIARNIGLDNKTVQNYLNILTQVGLIRLVAENKAGSNLLKSTEKIFLDNPNLYRVLAETLGAECCIGTVRELFFINMLANSNHQLFCSSLGDFTVDGYNFEIGGKGKDSKQIASSLENSFLVKDNINYCSRRELPLFLFGFLY